MTITSGNEPSRSGDHERAATIQLPPVPAPVRRFAVLNSRSDDRSIWFAATPDIVKAIQAKDVGEIHVVKASAMVILKVSPLMDFDEVAAWMRQIEEMYQPIAGEMAE